MLICWTPEAASNLEDILLYIATNNPDAAQQTVDQIYARIEELIMFPNLGRPGREEGTRELVMPPLPYIAVYLVSQSAVEVLRIWHGARQRH